METRLITKISNEDDIRHFIFDWHRFIIDYWWRQRYNVPFGSPQHRSMNFIDMAIEYEENKIIREYRNKDEREDDENLGIVDTNEIKVSNEQIDEDYDNLDLSQFD